MRVYIFIVDILSVKKRKKTMILVLFWAKEFGQLRNESVNSRWVAVRRWLALVKMTWIERLVWLTSTSSLRSLSLRSNWSIFLLRSELFSVKLVNDRSVSFAIVRSNVFKLSKFVSSFFNSLRVVWKRNTKSNRSRKFLFDWEMKKNKTNSDPIDFVFIESDVFFALDFSCF